MRHDITSWAVAFIFACIVALLLVLYWFGGAPA
jgi:hypothetical protein